MAVDGAQQRPRSDAAGGNILLLGFAAALRRRELVALDLKDVEETGDGIVVHLRRSKTDQEAAGEDRAVPFGQHPETCPVRALRAWLEAVPELGQWGGAGAADQPAQLLGDERRLALFGGPDRPPDPAQ